MAFENNAYCDFSGGAAKAVAGKDLLLAIFDMTGEKLMAISGQQSLTINRDADSIDVSTKDTKGGWKSKIAGMKEWSIDTDGVHLPTDESTKTLNAAFENSDLVCLKVINQKTKESLFGGVAMISSYSINAGMDEAAGFDLTLEGNGPLVDLMDEDAGQMPGETDPGETEGTN